MNLNGLFLLCNENPIFHWCLEASLGSKKCFMSAVESGAILWVLTKKGPDDKNEGTHFFLKKASKLKGTCLLDI